MSDISQEQAFEYRQVAALLCLDIDTLLESCNRQEVTVESLKDSIKLLVELKDQLINDPEARQRRYAAAQSLFNLSPVKEDGT